MDVIEVDGIRCCNSMAVTMFNNTFLHYSPSLNTETLTLTIMLSIFAILGSIGNSLATFVFYKVRDKTTAQIFILYMSVIDLFTCTVIIPFTVVVEYLRYDVRFDGICKLYQFLITSKVPLSAFIMVAIAFDRYFCICHPLRRIVTPFRMKMVILCLTIFACTLGIITCLSYGVYRRASIPTLSFSDSKLDGIGSKFMDWRPMADEPVSSDDVSQSVMSFIMEYLKKRNVSHTVTSLGDQDQVVYIGTCLPNSLVLDLNFLYVYQKVYSVLFVVCLVVVAILYGLILRFIQLRRSKKLQQKLVLCTYMNGEQAFEGTRMTLLNGNDDEHPHLKSKDSLHEENNTLKVDQNKNNDIRRTSSFMFDADKLRDETRTANIKTAIMLFTVTVVFVIAFLPAWLMAHKFIPPNIVIFYMYFSYNVANPCIYAFMNPVFQETLKKIYRRSS
ncbi:hypothetical protein LOTGIDRAFT_158556 [Lottia gigantea]|uniref:G-protein coupled receptors family 1 profile domain-containing protein n=1 Tax=Lottia gigantea TaxID=225164 RepID=V4AWS3_LOTGI|nr:hypothetical protein LOTGIDRAFT_158556 [Lottia gigantea]ESO99470.1 hypothetical protein LOTGIDRAFT_158556 [Lottia gigantea]